MVRDKAERRPVRPGCDILRSASGATQSGTDFRNRAIGSKAREQHADRQYRVMRAAVAPALHIDISADEIAQHDRLYCLIAFGHGAVFEARHNFCSTMFANGT